jgi:formate dehydrogenase assembly factor FdhD
MSVTPEARGAGPTGTLSCPLLLTTLSIPAERALTVYVDKRELVTLMTLGAHPELLVLGYLRNQRLVTSAF